MNTEICTHYFTASETVALMKSVFGLLDDDARQRQQDEAVDAGLARYVADEDGKLQFEWTC